jgi:predicted hydrocarbon binding protein
VPGAILRPVLQAIHDTSGPQYGNLLNAAGLNRYTTAMPDSGWQPVATQDELERLYTTVYQMLGESLTRLFMRNYGWRLVGQLQETKEVQDMIARINALDLEHRLEAFTREFVRFSSRGWATIQVSQDDRAWYFELEHCLNCAGIHDAADPICQGAAVVYATLAKACVGRVIYVSELACAATGDPHCVFSLSK